MSLNHIVYETVPDDEKLDVKFKNVYCDQVITGSGPGPIPIDGDGFVDAVTGAQIESLSSEVTIDSLYFSNSTASKNHSTFIWNVKTNVNMVTATNFYLLKLTIPTSIKNYFDAHPFALETGYMSVMGYSNTVTATPSFVANMMYYADSIVKFDNSVIRVGMNSFSASSTGLVPSTHRLHLQISFNGPPEERK